VGTFSHKFSIAHSSKTTDRIKKVRGAKMGRTSSITMPSMVGIVGRAPAVDEKVWCFFCLSVCLFVTLWNDEVCDNGNDMKQYNFQNNYGVIAQRKVCSCAPMFKFSYRPPEFFPRGKFLASFCAAQPQFFKVRTVKFPSPRQNFVKIA